MGDDDVAAQQHRSVVLVNGYWAQCGVCGDVIKQVRNDWLHVRFTADGCDMLVKPSRPFWILRRVKRAANVRDRGLRVGQVCSWGGVGSRDLPCFLPSL